jgi:23S rRNA (cytosine1962-C5)-methyltransferase
MSHRLILKPGKSKPILDHHHWIFSGAVAQLPEDVADGDIVQVFDADQTFLGQAYLNTATSIVARMIAWDDRPIAQVIAERIASAIKLRETCFSRSETNTYRLIHGEGDALPGLTVDRYGDVLVMQIATLGMDKLKNLVVNELVEQLKPLAIWEKSDTPSRKIEGLESQVGWLYGKPVETIEVMENGLRFLIDFSHVQKTGLFLDQREMRQLVREISYDKVVLNCFGYTGGFTIAALKGGAKRVDTIDISDDAIEGVKANLIRNGCDLQQNRAIAGDVFAWLRENDLSQYDIIILDPPAFAKKRSDVTNAMRAYRDINRLAIAGAPHGAIIVTSSCSALVDETLFQKVVFQAAQSTGRAVRILHKHRLAADHPINIYHPESNYLKSLVLFVE